MRGPESKLVDKILEYLRGKGGWWIKIHGGMYQTGGLPDIIGCRKGQFYGFEVKTPEAYTLLNHNLSGRQKLTLVKIREWGGVADVVCSIEQVGRLLK